MGYPEQGGRMENTRAGFKVRVSVQCLVRPASLCDAEGGQLGMGSVGQVTQRCRPRNDNIITTCITDKQQ